MQSHDNCFSCCTNFSILIAMRGSYLQMSFKYFFFNKDDDRKVQEDTEIQGFYHELTADRAVIGYGGCGMKV